MILVPLFDFKFLRELAATAVGNLKSAALVSVTFLANSVKNLDRRKNERAA
jgi:hypothetical protein